MRATPSEITQFKDFGWGRFTDEELADKTAVVRAHMARRPAVSAKPRMSVVVPAFREQQYLLGTLRSLAAQTHRDVEFAVVSNGEPYGNETQRIAEASGFTVIHEPGKGWDKAHEAGLESAHGEIYATTDADTLHGPEWLTAVDRILKDTRAVAATGPVRFVDVKLTRRMYRFAADIYKRLLEYDGLKLMRGAWGANSFYQREALREAGGYTDLRRDIWADTAVLYRVLPHGGEAVMSDPRTQVFSSARRMNKTPISELMANAFRRRLHLLGIHDVFQEADIR